MKIAVACDGQQISGHFGHCEGYCLFETDHQTIIRQQWLANPGHRPGFLPHFLHDQGVDVLITGGIGVKAMDLFSSKGIEVISGATGDRKQAAMDYLNGRLRSSSGSGCSHHGHQGFPHCK